MDFSTLNSAEQAHMSRILEKKQVSLRMSIPRTSLTLPHRCKTFSKCIPTWSNAVSTHAVTTLQAKLYRQKKFVSFLSLFWTGLVDCRDRTNVCQTVQTSFWNIRNELVLVLQNSTQVRWWFFFLALSLRFLFQRQWAETNRHIITYIDITSPFR